MPCAWRRTRPMSGPTKTAWSTTPTVLTRAPGASSSRRPTRAARPAATTAEESAEGEDAAQSAAPFRYESLEVASPGAEETLWNIEGTLNVTLALTPALRPGTPDPGVLRWQPENRDQHDLPARRSLAGSSQPPGGGAGRDGQHDDSQQDESLLRATEHRILDGGGSGPGALQQSPGRILDSLSSGIVLLDDNLLIVDLNPAAENVLGISRQRAHGQSLLRLVDDEPEMREILVARRRDRRPLRQRNASCPERSASRRARCRLPCVAGRHMTMPPCL